MTKLWPALVSTFLGIQSNCFKSYQKHDHGNHGDTKSYWISHKTSWNSPTLFVSVYLDSYKPEIFKVGMGDKYDFNGTLNLLVIIGLSNK